MNALGFDVAREDVFHHVHVKRSRPSGIEEIRDGLTRGAIGIGAVHEVSHRRRNVSNVGPAEGFTLRHTCPEKQGGHVGVLRERRSVGGACATVVNPSWLWDEQHVA